MNNNCNKSRDVNYNTAYSSACLNDSIHADSEKQGKECSTQKWNEVQKTLVEQLTGWIHNGLLVLVLICNIRLAKYDGNYTKSSFKTHFLVCSGSRVSSLSTSGHMANSTASKIFLQQWSPIFQLHLLQNDPRQ